MSRTKLNGQQVYLAAKHLVTAVEGTGAQVYRTDRNGSIAVSLDGNTLDVTTQRGGGSRPRSSRPTRPTASASSIGQLDLFEGRS